MTIERYGVSLIEKKEPKLAFDIRIKIRTTVLLNCYQFASFVLFVNRYIQLAVLTK